MNFDYIVAEANQDEFAKYMNPPQLGTHDYNYLFEFKFESGTIKSNLIKWCRDNKIDYLTGHLGGFYADIYGEDKYYYLHTESTGNKNFEVYAVKSDMIKRDQNFSRIIPLVPRAIKITLPERKFRLTLANGDKVIVSEYMPSIEAKSKLLGRKYKVLPFDCNETSVCCAVEIVA